MTLKWPFEVDPILDQLFVNDTINRSRFPIFQKDRRRLIIVEKDINFFLNAHYDFKKQIWKSGFFKIQETDWEITDETEYKYPILGNGFLHSYGGVWILLQKVFEREFIHVMAYAENINFITNSSRFLFSIFSPKSWSHEKQQILLHRNTQILLHFDGSIISFFKYFL